MCQVPLAQLLVSVGDDVEGPRAQRVGPEHGLVQEAVELLGGEDGVEGSGQDHDLLERGAQGQGPGLSKLNPGSGSIPKPTSQRPPPKLGCSREDSSTSSPAMEPGATTTAT